MKVLKENRMKKLKIRVLCVLMVVLALMPAACKKEEAPEQKIKEFAKDIVFEVNGMEVSLGEWNLYARPTISGINNLYGKEIWDFKMDAEGKLFGESLRDDIQKRIVSVKLVASKAGELGVALTEDDKSEIALKTDEYLEKLSTDLQEKYSINKEAVEKVYTDNMLATKVYENLILNVDTSADDEEVRHMDLRYIMFPKVYENRSGETVFHTDEEIAQKRAEFNDVREKVSAGQDRELKDFETEELTVTDIVADLARLKEMLPEEQAGVVFWLRNKEVSPLIETDEALFLFECENVRNEENTNAARIKVIERREQQVFEEAYSEWKKDVRIENNETLWKDLASDQ